MEDLTSLGWAVIALPLFGGFWASAPYGLPGPIPAALVLSATIALAVGAFPYVVALMALAGLVRAAALGYPRTRPRSAVSGAVFGVVAVGVTTGAFPAWLLIFSIALVLADTDEAFDRVETEN